MNHKENNLPGPELQKVIDDLQKRLYNLEKENREISVLKEKAEKLLIASEERIKLLISELEEAENSQSNAQTTLIEKELKYQTLFEEGGDAILMMSGDKFTDCNSRAAILFDFPKEEIIGKTPLAFTPEYQSDGRSSHEKAMEKINAALKGKRQRFEWIHQKRDGTNFDTEVTLIAIEIGGEKMLQAIVRDITKRKAAEVELKLSEEKYRKIFENVQDVFFITDIRGNLTDISPSIERHTGYPLSELIGKPVYAHFSRREERLRFMRELLLSGEINEFETEMVDKEKKLFFVSVNAHFRLDSTGAKIGIEGSIRDISQRKRAELELIAAKDRAEESDKLKSAFLANMSHEIRTPMNGILGFLTLLGEPDLEEEARREFVKVVTQSGERLLNTINDIIEMSKIEAELGGIILEKVDPVRLIRELYEFFHPQAVENCLELTYNIPEKPLSVVLSDYQKVTTVLTNLIKNAFKFTKKGEIELGCYLNGASLVFYVKDTGIGIAKERLEAIFERFTQADVSLIREHEGSGLGLAIAKGYANLLDGRIWVESTLGAGSTFFFSVPYSGISDNPILESKDQITPDISLEGLTILIAEDDEAGLLFMKAVLEAEGVNLIHASNGQEAIELVGKGMGIDIVLMDIRMPVMDGLIATREIRRRGIDIPIIAQSAFAFVQDQLQAKEAGCDDYLTKPISRKELISMIQRYVKTDDTN